MKQAKFNWLLSEKTAIPEAVDQQMAKDIAHPLARQILWNRGIQTEEAYQRFLFPSVTHLHDPFLFFEMDKTIARIQQAIQNEEQILIYGDYDADGITSVAVMKEALEIIGGNVTYFLPNRFTHGYELNEAVFAQYLDSGVQLIITVDNGVTGNKAIQYAKQHGVDVIVTDHHELPPVLPEAFSIIHPRHPKGHYPFKELAGVGVAFKVATALLEEVPMDLLDLVAIGTIADVVSLTDENRTLVQMGLETIRTGERLGLDTLLQLAGCTKSGVSEETIGFTLAPQLNALGRLGEATPGVTLLTTFDEEEAEKIATLVVQQNEARKEIVKQITEEAFASIRPEDRVHVLVAQHWHEGVLGIVAGKLMQETGRPVLLLTLDAQKQVAKGSGRSIPSVNLYEALNEVRELFLQFGGHHAAVGMTIAEENIDKLKAHLSTYMAEMQADLKAPLVVESVLSLTEISDSLIQSLEKLAPFGTDNPVPLFLFEQVMPKQVRQIGADKNHLKCQFTQNQKSLDVVAFQMGPQIHEFMFNALDAVGRLSMNEWNGRKNPQLMLTDFAVQENQLFDLRSKAARQSPIVEAATYYIFFEKKIQTTFTAPDTQKILCISVDDCAAQLKEKAQQLVFVDCPNDLADIRRLTLQTAVTRVYLMGLTLEEAYLTGMGTKQQFATLYAFIQQQTAIDVRYKLSQVANYLKIDEKLLIFMIRVFFDLKFVTIKNGVLEKVDAPKNRSLEESQTYQQRLKQVETEKFLLYSDQHELQRWLWNKEEE